MTSDVATRLGEIEALLVSGQRLSMQGSYERRAPAPESMSMLTRARDELKALVSALPSSAHAWQLLSNAHEALLEYGPAIAALQESIRVAGRKDKRDLKRLARLREAAAQWSRMPLSPAQLAELGAYLRDKLAGGVGTRDLRWTEAWLKETQAADADAVVRALRDRGGFSDFEVLSNVVS